MIQLVGEQLYFGYARPRPYDVTIIGRWSGYSFPAAPVAVLAMVLIGITYTLVPAGRARSIAKWVGEAIVVVFAAAELYLGTFHPFDIAVGLTFTVAILLNAFRFFTPNEVFPVAYRQGKTAHLDVGGQRGAALRQAVQDQLGLKVIDVKPVGLAGSGGSTPLRLTVEGDPNTYLFGKLYAMNHVRADRWYKLGRTLLYGRLEDEAPFQSVQRLVEYEDYGLRLMRDSGILTATPYGIVEMTPAREYLLLTEFFDGAEEIGDAVVDDGIIDEGLLLVRQLWDAGLAHRDIKPANLLVRDGKVLLIDVAFMQLRPSPWRQAVDLANMMLVLAVRTDADRVYERALRYFTADEIAEAFAAARGVASPTQLRTVMKKDGRDLLARFRALAPERRPISLQRWSPRRVLLAAALLLGAVVVIPLVLNLLTPAHDARDRRQAVVRHERRDDPHGANRPGGHVGAVSRDASRGLGPRRRGGRGRERDSSGSTPTSGATVPSKRRCCRATSAGSRARARCRATKPGSGATSGSSNFHPTCAARATTSFPAAASPTSSRSTVGPARR